MTTLSRNGCAMYFEVDRTEYHSDMVSVVETLNQTTANVIVNKSARHAWAQHPRLGGKPPKATAAMDLGNVIDEILLGNSRRVVEVDAPDFRTNAAKAVRDEAIAGSKFPVVKHKLADLQDECSGLRKALDIAGIDIERDGIHKQVAVLWEETASNGAKVWCRCLMDMFDIERMEIIDLKSGKDLRPKKIPGKYYDGYALQAAAYISAVEHVYPDHAGRVQFSNVWIEADWPHVAYTSEPDGECLQFGRVQWQKAIDAWEECLRTAKWPGYAARGERLRIGLPAWGAAEMLANDDEEEGEDASTDE